MEPFMNITAEMLSGAGQKASYICHGTMHTELCMAYDDICFLSESAGSY